MANLKLKIKSIIPAAISALTGIAIKKNGLSYTVGLDYSQLVQASQFDATNTLLAVWNKFTGTWNVISPAALTSGSFQSVAAASNTVPDGTSLLAVQRAAPAATALTLPRLINQGGKALTIADFSTSVTNHAITITPGDTATIMGQSSWTIYSTAGQPASVTLSPSLDLNSWTISPNALVPTTTRGDLVVRNATNNARLPLGTSGYSLMSNGTDPVWTGFLQSGTGAVTRTWNGKASDVFSVKDFGAYADNVHDDTGAFSAAAKAAIANSLPTNSTVTTAQSCMVFVPPGSYYLASPVDTGGRSVDWILDDGALFSNIVNLGGRVVRESGLRMARPTHYGCYDTACSLSVTANYSPNEPPAVAGISSNSAISTYASRDSVAAYIANTAPAALYTLAPLAAPTNGALTATAGGALAAATYYVRSTWVNASGETLGATETSLAVAVNNVLNVAAPASAPAGATGWNVYVSTTAGTETRQNGATPIAIGTAWVEPTTGLVAGAALPSSNTTGPNYTATTVTCPAPVDPTQLKVGMMIDTAHSPKWTGFITAWAANGSSITVSAWYQNGGGGAAGTPTSGVNATVNPITKIWAQNSGVTLNASSYGNAAAGYELDVYNSKGDSNSYAAVATGQTWGFDSYGVGPNKCSAGFVSRGNWLNGYVSDNALTGSVGYVTRGAENPGFSYESQVPGGTAFRTVYNGQVSFNVSNTGDIEFGRVDVASTTVFDWHSSGNNIDYDARISCSGGTATIGQATLNYVAATHSFSGTASFGQASFSGTATFSGALNCGVLNPITDTSITTVQFNKTSYVSGASYFASFSLNGTLIGSISGNGSTTTYATTSDYRLKTNVVPMQGALDSVMRLKPVAYEWKSSGEAGEGFIAHELAEICPLAVVGEKDAIDDNGAPIYQSIDTGKLVGRLTAAMQEMKRELDAVKAQLNLVNAQLASRPG